MRSPTVASSQWAKPSITTTKSGIGPSKPLERRAASTEPAERYQRRPSLPLHISVTLVTNSLVFSTLTLNLWSGQEELYDRGSKFVRRCSDALPAKPNRAAWLEGPSTVCAPQPGLAHPWRLILLGAPGVGKGTQADLLSQRLGACHLSTGDVFRAAGQSACEPSPAMTAALDCMHRGALVPDHTVWEIVRERSGCLHCRGGFILDGFPAPACRPNC